MRQNDGTRCVDAQTVDASTSHKGYIGLGAYLFFSPIIYGIIFTGLIIMTATLGQIKIINVENVNIS